MGREVLEPTMVLEEVQPNVPDATMEPLELTSG